MPNAQRPTPALGYAPGPNARVLPEGPSPEPVPLPHFPDRLHAFVWRNWTLVPLERLAEVVSATVEQVRGIGVSMGLPEPPPVTPDQWRRSYLTIIRRNWHLLPYEQLLTLLDWTAEELAYVLQEDDFLYIKLGRLKPRCELLRYASPDEPARRRAAEIAAIVREHFGEQAGLSEDPLFGFVRRLSEPPEDEPTEEPAPSCFSPRYCYSYFALYGDPLLEPELDPFPDGYLARLARSGVDGVWLQGVLYKLAPFPWDPALSDRCQERLTNLKALVERAAKYGVGIYLYLNEPRTMPLAFFEAHPELKGVTAGDRAVLCTSHPDVQAYLRDSVEALCRAVPDLAGIFTITASENQTSCWSHHRGDNCPRCGPRGASAVIAEVNGLIAEGIRRAGSETRFIAWDWGWRDQDAEAIIRGLPPETWLQSVCEWDLPINRGGVETTIGEYCLSAVGPGPRALRHWKIARECGLKTIAKIQANCTWELSAVPYIPVVENAARIAANLRDAGVDGLMLGWTLGGYPSPNLEVVAEVGRDPSITAEEAAGTVARRLYGDVDGPLAATLWKAFGEAFEQFPYHGGTVYTAPMQFGPANLLWGDPTGYKATMIGFPYDDVDTWRAVYPPVTFAQQLWNVADGWRNAVREIVAIRKGAHRERDRSQALSDDLTLYFASGLHMDSTANQVAFNLVRQDLFVESPPAYPGWTGPDLETLLRNEIAVAVGLYRMQVSDSRIGFEASNQYYYVPLDLVEKVLNCRDLLDRWLPEQKAKWGMKE